MDGCNSNPNDHGGGSYRNPTTLLVGCFYSAFDNSTLELSSELFGFFFFFFFSFSTSQIQLVSYRFLSFVLFHCMYKCRRCQFHHNRLAHHSGGVYCGTYRPSMRNLELSSSWLYSRERPVQERYGESRKQQQYNQQQQQFQALCNPRHHKCDSVTALASQPELT